MKGGSLAANVKLLCGPHGRGAPFRLRRAVPVDMFSDTPHVELCLLLERTEQVRATAERSVKQHGRRNRQRLVGLTEGMATNDDKAPPLVVS